VIERWYSPNHRYTRTYIFWLIENLPALRAREWPKNPRGSGYIDLPLGKRGRSWEAYFVRRCLVAADIEMALENCEKDGLILEATICWGKTDQALAKHLGIPVWSIRKRAKRALAYIVHCLKETGIEERRRMSYREFKGIKKQKNAVLSR